MTTEGYKNLEEALQQDPLTPDKILEFMTTYPLKVEFPLLSTLDTEDSKALRGAQPGPLSLLDYYWIKIDPSFGFFEGQITLLHELMHHFYNNYIGFFSEKHEDMIDEHAYQFQEKNPSFTRAITRTYWKQKNNPLSMIDSE